MEKYIPTLRESFYGISTDRVIKLLEDPVFVQRTALLKLSSRLFRMEEEGRDVDVLREMLDQFYTPVVQMLNKKLKDEGWGNAEISAAQMITEGNLKLK